uniref:uncharacterized protein LOC122582936 n=1 Tax=Erigeron canadensis TaxID=72917 RepID=UPI001CB94D9B|nr:uncharacterized protein LOC122582936 [Erigeron canadensis]
MLGSSSNNNDNALGGLLTHFQCPVLNSTNYPVWAIRFKTILETNGIWEIIEPGTGTDVKKNKAAMAYIFQALSEDLVLQVASCKTAKEVWDALKTRYVGEDRVQKARLQTLKSEFDLQMNEEETINAFTAKINEIVTKAANLGSTFDQPSLVQKLLNSVPDRFIQIVASIEQHCDLDEMALDDAIGRLKAFEERTKFKKNKESDNQNKLLLTRHNNNINQGRRFGKRGQDSSRGRGRGKYKGEGHNSEDLEGNDNKPRRNVDKSQIDCYKCGSTIVSPSKS